MSYVYVVDTNFFIQAHRVTYPLDVVPSFWNKVRKLAENGKIISIDKVKKEIFNNDDELKEWCENNLSPSFWKDSNLNSLEYLKIATWGASQTNRYTQKAIQEFLDAEEADAFLIAFTLADLIHRKIVTYERPNNKKDKIKIPDVCAVFGILYLDPISMFRELGETF
jgi:hypothetical protein